MTFSPHEAVQVHSQLLLEQDLVKHMAFSFDDNNALFLRDQFCTLMILLSVALLTGSNFEAMSCDVIRF